jgi:hypothetical protein
MQSRVIQALVRLHNLVIDNDKPDFGTIALNADGTIDPAELQLFGIEPLLVGVEDGEGPVGSIGFIGYDGLEYDEEDGACARRQAIELEANDIHRPPRLL